MPLLCPRPSSAPSQGETTEHRLRGPKDMEKRMLASGPWSLSSEAPRASGGRRTVPTVPGCVGGGRPGGFPHHPDPPAWRANSTRLSSPGPAAAHRTLQNYLVWRLVLDRISSLSRRFRDARANYRKVRAATRRRPRPGQGTGVRATQEPRAAGSGGWAAAPRSALSGPTSLA